MKGQPKKEKPRKKLRYVRFYLEPWREVARQLNTEALGMMFRAALEYADTGTEPDLSRHPSLYNLWLFYRTQLDSDIERHGRSEN